MGKLQNVKVRVKPYTRKDGTKVKGHTRKITVNRLWKWQIAAVDMRRSEKALAQDKKRKAKVALDDDTWRKNPASYDRKGSRI